MGQVVQNYPSSKEAFQFARLDFEVVKGPNTHHLDDGTEVVCLGKGEKIFITAKLSGYIKVANTYVQNYLLLYFSFITQFIQAINSSSYSSLKTFRPDGFSSAGNAPSRLLGSFPSLAKSSFSIECSGTVSDH